MTIETKEDFDNKYIILTKDIDSKTLEKINDKFKSWEVNYFYRNLYNKQDFPLAWFLMKGQYFKEERDFSIANINCPIESKLIKNLQEISIQQFLDEKTQ